MEITVMDFFKNPFYIIIVLIFSKVYGHKNKRKSSRSKFLQELRLVLGQMMGSTWLLVCSLEL